MSNLKIKTRVVKIKKRYQKNIVADQEINYKYKGKQYS